MKTSMQQTSLLAWADIQDTTIGRMQKRVFDFLSQSDPYTNCEISRALNMPINCVTPRVHELRKMGAVIGKTKRRCSITGRLAIPWTVRKEEPPESMEQVKHYLLFIFKDVEPSLYGPYPSEEIRDQEARRIRQKEGEDHGIYKLDTTGQCIIESYSGAFFDEDAGRR